jgi:drug/metabolite transporter (DMT)-like permease
MTSPPAAPDGVSSRHALVVLVFLTVVWGLNWPAMKLAVEGFPPWQFRAACALFGIATLFGLAWASGRSVRPPPGLWGTLALAGILNVTGWQVFSAMSLQHIDSGRGAIVAYTMPLMTALLSVPLLGERPSLRILAALLLGTSGMALLLPDDLLGRGDRQLLGLFLMLMAALSWALGTIQLKYVKLPMPTMVATAWFFVFAFPPQLLGALFEPLPDPAALTWPVVLGALYAATIPVVFGYWAWFRLVEVLPATVASIATLATPVIGVLSGALLLAEPVGWREVVALGLVIVSLVLVLYRTPSMKE